MKTAEQNKQDYGDLLLFLHGKNQSDGSIILQEYRDKLE